MTLKSRSVAGECATIAQTWELCLNNTLTMRGDAAHQDLESHASAKAPNFCRSCTGRAAPSPRMRGLGIGGCGTSTLVSRIGQAGEMVRWWQGEVSR